MLVCDSTKERRVCGRGGMTGGGRRAAAMSEASRAPVGALAGQQGPLDMRARREVEVRERRRKRGQEEAGCLISS